jgi:hypothetical protein
MEYDSEHDSDYANGDREVKRVKYMHNLEGLPQFPHPFHSSNESTSYPRTKEEQYVFELTTILRNKPKWYEKIHDPVIVEKWCDEATAALEKHDLSYSESEDDEDDEDDEKNEKSVNRRVMEVIDQALAQLLAWSNERDGLIEISPADKVYQADGLISDSLKQELIQGVSILENVPDDQKDWHPGSKGQVLDLVHPSLYCLVNSLSPVRAENEAELIEEAKRGVSYCLANMNVGEPIEFDHCNDYSGEYAFSDQYQWLPSEFIVSEDGTTKIETYINNLHPEEHIKLYSTLESIFSQFVPLFNKVLSASSGKFVDLRGRRLQVIVKLANIIIAPESSYDGGNYHVEGMKNENIVASGIYYYTSDNITESILNFRRAVCDPYGYVDSNKAVARVDAEYHFGDVLNEECGAVITQEDRCIAFPNIMQHQVDYIDLVDETKPGVRKILVFFLVDPGHRIHSTLHVPPQQMLWFVSKLLEKRSFGDLPIELIEKIIDYMETPLTLEQTKQDREALMEERTSATDDNNDNYFCQKTRTFNFCEH